MVDVLCIYPRPVTALARVMGPVRAGRPEITLAIDERTTSGRRNAVLPENLSAAIGSLVASSVAG
jgi:hypothetical protein